MARIYFILCTALILGSCNKQTTVDYPAPEADLSKTFTSVPSSYSGITFNNALDISQLKSPLQAINVYNGGGVAVGDINNDGLVDIYFTGNLSNNRLYLNKGGFKFEDITASAGVASDNKWSTGTTIVDVNNDGLLDIYVCNGYHDDANRRENQLYINNGDLTFTDKAAEYGLNDNGYSIMASFFDYDKDGKLDVFVGNHPKDRFLSYEVHYQNWLNPPFESSNHLYRNIDNGHFENVTIPTGLLSYGWTLGMVTVDLNQDDWPDIYVTVDHTEPDRFYINNRDGTFREVSKESLKHMSQSSMGVDAGDINNDGLPDLAVVEMLSADYYRAKTQMQNMDVDRFWDFVIKDHNYQYMRNMLHVNNGNGTFREVGQMAQIHKTDWSWASLFMDIDNDGWQDLFVSNGYFRDYSDQDYRISYNEKLVDADESGNNSEKIRLLTEHARDAGSTKLKNYMFRNKGNYIFEDVSADTGLDFEGFSNGAAYADFDNDGDLDLVVNNINDEVSLYSNNTSELQNGNNWLRVTFDPGKGRHSLGAKVTIETDTGIQYREHTLTRGYQSAVEDALHFGLGKADVVKALTVTWPDGKTQILNDLEPNSRIELQYKKAGSAKNQVESKNFLFEDVPGRAGLTFNHREKYFDDYDKQVLLPHQMSCFGPAFAKGDLNSDGLEDIYLGGAQDQAPTLYIQNSNGFFDKTQSPALEADQSHEDLAAAFFDADGDGDLDLYVVSGGNEMPQGDSYYQDRLYLNDGQGNLEKANNRIPKITTSGSTVKPFDYDSDGDLDLFIGSRHVPGSYPFAPKSFLLENNNGTFKDVTNSKAAVLNDLGMVTDAVWTDLNQDGQTDLLVVGEWMPVSFLIMENGILVNRTEEMGMSKTRGWWNRIHLTDIDGDGDDDYVLGNLGLNYKYQVDDKKSFYIYAGDFDNNGSSDIVLGTAKNNKRLPVRGKQCSTEQIPGLEQKFPTYDAFANATLDEVYGEDLDNALYYEIDNFYSSILVNEGASIYDLIPLPVEAQSSPINGIVSKDFDGDGILDLLMAGNMHTSEVETGRADSGIGFFLKGDGKGNFVTKFAHETGFFARGDVKNLELLKAANGTEYILVVKNNTDLQVVQ